MSAIMRRCPKCGETKPRDDFHKKPDYCRPCKQARDTGRVRYPLTGRDFKNRTPEARARKRRWTERHSDPVKNAARRAVRQAVISGRLVVEPCLHCGQSPLRADGVRAVQAHHHNGYENPLDIIWLCVKCHTAEHRKDAARTGDSHER